MKCKWQQIIICFLVFTLLISIPSSQTLAWTYTVRPGDSLWTIARKTGVSVNSIRSSSGYCDSTIKPGQKLIIPDPDNSGSRSGIYISSSERELLARVVQAEAANEPYKGQVSVAAVILNRKYDPRFPNTITGNIYKPHAFESVTNGLIWRVTPTQQSYNAVRDAINGWDPSYGSLFFWNPYKYVNPWVWSRPITIQYGKHVFAK